MTYISGGDLVAKRSPWRMSIVSDLFWGVVNFFGVFVSSIFADPGTLRSSGGRSNGNGNGYGGGSGSGGNNGPRRPIGTIRSRETINQPMGGCGSCCG